MRLGCFSSQTTLKLCSKSRAIMSRSSRSVMLLMYELYEEPEAQVPWKNLMPLGIST